MKQGWRAAGREQRLEASLVQNLCKSFHRLPDLGKKNKHYRDCTIYLCLAVPSKPDVGAKVWIPVMLLVLPSSLLITDVVVGQQVYLHF